MLSQMWALTIVSIQRCTGFFVDSKALCPLYAPSMPPLCPLYTPKYIFITFHSSFLRIHPSNAITTMSTCI